MTQAALVDATTYHGRRGGPANAFRYKADFVLLPVRAQEPAGLRLFSRNRWNLFSQHDDDHGVGEISGRAWAERVIAEAGLSGVCDGDAFLLTQPRRFGYVFNPVSFWFFKDREGALRAVIAEVNNTFGDRHAYLCRHADARPIAPHDRIEAEKVFHVSPFQDVDGRYAFRFRLDDDLVAAYIDYRAGERGVYATLTGALRPMTDGALLLTFLRRPLGALGVIALIHWQALRLKLKGARWRMRPEPPKEQVTTS